MTMSWESYLRASAVPRDLLDQFVKEPGWAVFDPELGYTLQSCFTPFGMNGTGTIETFQANGARSAFMYAGRTPRIHAYGDSFTECSQVSDGETWQEYLGAHLGEPIANFGVGGYGVYQAYRRMLRNEAGERGAPYLILYIWGDDPTRSLMRARWPVMYPFFAPIARAFRLFHGNFWSHLELDLGDRAVRRARESPGDTGRRLPDGRPRLDGREPARRPRDPARRVRRLAALGHPGVDRRARPRARRRAGPRARHRLRLARRRSAPRGGTAPQPVRPARDELRARQGRRRSRRARQAAARRAERDRARGRRRQRRRAQRPGDRRSPGARRLRLVRHERRARRRARGGRRSSYAEYMQPYLVGATGHYNPRGNHLFAYAIKDKLVAMLDPSPCPTATCRPARRSTSAAIYRAITE